LFLATLERGGVREEARPALASCAARHHVGDRRDPTELATQLARRLNPELAPILDWARRARLRCVVISASPSPIVELGARLWDFIPEDVVATVTTSKHGRIEPTLARPVAYGELKRELGLEKLRGLRWLASFGDSAFDLQMLLAARIGVAVRPKWALSASIAALPSVVLLGG
jgi:phosphoserine phosphatase